MKQKLKIAVIMLVMILSAFLSTSTYAKPKPQFQNKKVTINQGQLFYLRILNNTKKVKWKTSNKKIVQLKHKSRTGVYLKGKKKGKAVITARIGKKTLRCKVTIKKRPKNSNDYDYYDASDYIERKIIDGVEFGVFDDIILSNSTTAMKQIEVRPNTSHYDLGLNPTEIKVGQCFNACIPGWPDFIAELRTHIALVDSVFAKQSGFTYEYYVVTESGIRTGSFNASYYYHGTLLYTKTFNIKKVRANGNLYLRKAADNVKANAWDYNYWKDTGEFFSDDLINKMKTGTLSFRQKLTCAKKYIARNYKYTQLDCKGGCSVLAYICRDLGGTAYYKYYAGAGIGSGFVCNGYSAGAFGDYHHTTAVLFDDKGNQVGSEWEAQGHY